MKTDRDHDVPSRCIQGVREEQEDLGQQERLCCLGCALPLGVLLENLLVLQDVAPVVAGREELHRDEPSFSEPGLVESRRGLRPHRRVQQLCLDVQNTQGEPQSGDEEKQGKDATELPKGNRVMMIINNDTQRSAAQRDRGLL